MKGMGRNENEVNVIVTYAPKNTTFAAKLAIIVAVKRSGCSRYVRSAANHDAITATSGASMPSSNSAANMPRVAAVATSHDAALTPAIHRASLIDGKRF